MLVHPYNERDKDKLECFVGTRLLKDDLGVVGAMVRDPSDNERTWRVRSVYAPVPRRGIGGVRAKLVDQYDFITFINQRDLEVLLGLGTPGRYVPWMGADSEYPEPGEREWVGFFVDETDSYDDLYDQETILRQESPIPMLEGNSSIRRRLYLEEGRVPSTHRLAKNCEEEWDLLWDMDPETGMSPDLRIATINRRWSRTTRRQVPWSEAVY